jgi:hypothetical protein
MPRFAADRAERHRDQPQRRPPPIGLMACPVRLPAQIGPSGAAALSILLRCHDGSTTFL